MGPQRALYINCTVPPVLLLSKNALTHSEGGGGEWGTNGWEHVVDRRGRGCSVMYVHVHTYMQIPGSKKTSLSKHKWLEKPVYNMSEEDIFSVLALLSIISQKLPSYTALLLHAVGRGRRGGGGPGQKLLRPSTSRP